VRASISLALVGFLASSVLAGVSAHVYRADEITPLTWADPNIPDVYQDIMVGTRLTVFVGSDTAMPHWSGGLLISWEDSERGTLSGRGYNEQTGNHEGSILEASGVLTFVNGPKRKEFGVGINLSVESATVGEWIVLDYHAEAIGICDVELYSDKPIEDLPGDWPPAETLWIQGLTFNHVASRDHNDDDIVNFEDFAMFADQWRSMAPADPNVGLAPDPNAVAVVDIADLTLFCEYWLQRTDIEDPLSEPNTPSTEL